MKYLDLKAQYTEMAGEINSAISRVITNCSFIGGEEVKTFENEFKKKFEAPYFVSCGNGTDALFIALKAAGIQSGDEVITTAISWISTSEVISLAGAKPVFIDIDDYYCINADKIEEKINSKTKAIIPVHFYGQTCDMDKINRIAKKHKLLVIEDCAQAHLSEYNGIKSGLMGDFGTFSFYPGKNLGAYGDAGGLIVRDYNYYKRCKMFANHGMYEKRHLHIIEGMNSRMDGIQAAILSVKLNYIVEWTEKRIKIAKLYDKYLSEIENIIIPKIRPNSKHSYHVYAIKATKRDQLKDFLTKNNIETSIHYPNALPFMPCYEHMSLKKDDFINAFSLSNTELSLPIYPEMREEQVKVVADMIIKFYENINNF